MADDQSVTTTDEGFEPEPIPDNIADTALDGLNPADDSTESEQVETQPDETEQDQQQEDEAEADEPADESGEPEATEAEDTQSDGDEQPNEQPDPKELNRQAYEQRQAKKNYVQDERQRVRRYESELADKVRSGELDELSQIKENQRIIQANQYLDSVERTQMSIMNEGQQALSEIPFFKSASPQSNAIFQSALESFRDAYGVYDEESGALVATEDRKGNPVSLYSYLANEAAKIENIVSSAQRQTQKSEAKMRAKAVTPSNPGKVTSSGDDLEDLLDRIGDVRLV